MNQKKCLNCEKIFTKSLKYSWKQFNKIMFCGGLCKILFNIKTNINKYSKDDISPYLIVTKKGVDYKIRFSEKDRSKIKSYKWYIQHQGYVCTYDRLSTKKDKPKILMHWIILGKPPAGLVTDHINRNKLDNRRTNLRITTQSNNSHNKGISTKNTSGYNGVARSRKRNRFLATIKVKNKSHHLGYFDTIGDAVRCRNIVEKLFGVDFNKERNMI